jgi:hypothetical protein
MGKKITSALSFGLIISCSCGCIMAQDSVSCLDSLAAKIGTGRSLTVTDVSESSFSGRLLKIDLLHSSITIRRSIARVYSDSIIPYSNLKQIKYYRTRVRPLYCIAGTVIGGLLGLAIENSRSTGVYFSAGEWFKAHQGGIVAGSLIGCGVAMIFSFMIPSEKVIKCGG